MAPSSNPFWTFSLEFYARPGVAPACLGLQDRLGVDVNLLLFCLWTATQGVALDAGIMRKAVAYSKEWTTNVVGPLREVRRFLKDRKVDEFRNRVKAAELLGEQVEQQALFDLSPSAGHSAASPVLADANVALYFRIAELRPQDADRDALAVLRNAAFSQ
jgi:uncharacterized protein (TIGR02444 family)